MNNTGRMGIGVISAGKVGSALGSALRSQGHSIIGAYATSEASIDRLETMLPGVPALDVQTIVDRSEMVLLALPDDELAGLVSGLAKLNAWKPGQILVHTAGRYGVEVLHPAIDAGVLGLAIHPAMTFTGTSLDVARLQGCPFAVTTVAPFQAIGHALVAEMGGQSVIVAEEDRPAYHAALSHGANHVVTVIAQAMALLESIGFDEPGDYLRALVQASVEGALSSGDALLTGPIVRGDLTTLSSHLDSVDKAAQGNTNLDDLPPVYRGIAEATVERALRRRTILEATAKQMRDQIRANQL
ncbi:Rossmann-like and DUF2520 domain-containing protein [Arcanobacterium ihumii]|uniref:Rossmann-like and DUF2520 domain-containing protein n=1 Tax=Arcanobacterium ihumii TaxID=2138162 RepID=UPI000F52D10B|nr:DUF2520 domain-containing protein [Arcanobacterium ihumii]